jgi:hypothetical protein
MDTAERVAEVDSILRAAAHLATAEDLRSHHQKHGGWHRAVLTGKELLAVSPAIAASTLLGRVPLDAKIISFDGIVVLRCMTEDAVEVRYILESN